MGPTPITSSKKKTTSRGWFSFWNYRGRESEGGQKKPRWGFCPPLGSASKRERSSKSKFPAACAETPITSSVESLSVQRSFAYAQDDKWGARRLIYHSSIYSNTFLMAYGPSVNSSGESSVRVKCMASQVWG